MPRLVPEISPLDAFCDVVVVGIGDSRSWMMMALIIIVDIIDITQISEEEITRIFKEIDKDESGSITKKEAVRACRR